MTMKQIYYELIQVNYSTITLADLIDVVSLSGVATRYVRVNYIVDFTILTLQIVRFHYDYEISESLSRMPTSDISLTSVWLQSTLHIKLKPATGDGICKLFKIVSKLQKLMLDTIAPCVQVTFQSIMSTYKINTLRCTVPIRPNRK